ncbi:MAG: EAL domain-containing protein [Sphingomonadales bacterium]|nr:EAL domain-containing protein [Sphingomonadales bacterium]
MAWLKKSKRKTTRRRILLTAMLLTMVCGVIELGEPLEDLMRGARNMMLKRESDKKVVIVGIDDDTLDQLGMDYSESFDAKAIENLLTAGANHVYFDRVFKDINDENGSQALLATLKRHRGQVSFGVMITPDRFNHRKVSIIPSKRYLPYVEVTSLNGKSTPFFLANELNYRDDTTLGQVPSISSDIAGKSNPTTARYRPDLTIEAKTIPALSYLDVIEGHFDKNVVAGKDVVIGPDSVRIPDRYQVIGQGWVPGVYFHAIGAQTLREGTPSRPSWLYPYAVALLLAWLTVRTKDRRIAARMIMGTIALATVAPFVTDRMFMTVDYIPALLLYAIVAYRSHNFKAMDKLALHNADSQLPNLVAFRNENDAGQHPIAALTIKNYETILAAYPDLGAKELMEAISRPIMLTDPDCRIFHEDNTLYWKMPQLWNEQLASHLDGLAKLISSIRMGTAKIDLDFAIGIDIEYAEPLAKRINSAKIAASQAANQGLAHSFYSALAAHDAQWRLSLMSELDEAIRNDVLTVVYQPQLDLATGRMLSAEALVRWHHPTKGAIPPVEFIAQAEATNRIERLTYYVLEKALYDMVAVIELHPDFEISVNLSTKLLTNSQLPKQILNSLKRTGVDPNNLKLEITETAAMHDNPVVAANLGSLAAMGTKISIDDYGTGNATLEYLRNIPFNELKIDRQFITHLADSDRDQLLVKSTITLAHALGHTVTAEGVEDESTLRVLRKLKCDRIQGYHISRPVQIETLKVLMNQTPAKMRKR